MAGLIADVRSGELGPDDTVIYLHTGGGPSVFANLSAFAGNLD
jgi:1-aminocyclopropane-1-carboxylate deaminase/D-cysteine desulfhydrase-like pyridoxal-dependent ACC family enzyme